MEMHKAPVLCMVDYGEVFFTTQSLADQRGDDWSSAPYEHNAGDPYEPCWHNRPDQQREAPCRCERCQKDWNEDGSPKWEITSFCIEGVELAEPMDLLTRHYISVKDVNRGIVPWLTNGVWDEEANEDWDPWGDVPAVLTPPADGSPLISIMAGTSLEEFTRLIESIGGTVRLYEPTPE
ncbi:hypothetical protein HYV70_02255 [Candidatus Uhrbacteria bacterium]|nr:hypothetical protein [Candidatus Uhrbacteria bacterium]